MSGVRFTVTKSGSKDYGTRSSIELPDVAVADPGEHALPICSSLRKNIGSINLSLVKYRN